MEPYEHHGLPCWLFGFRDITAERIAQEQLTQSRETLLMMFQAAPVALMLVGIEDGLVHQCNQRMATMLDATISEILGHTTPRLYRELADRERLRDLLLSHGAIDNYVTQLVSLAGRPLWARLDAKVLSVDGERVFMVGAQDITHQKALEAKLLLLATTDPLTGVFNRRRLLETAGTELARWTRYGSVFSFAMIDADLFKGINDRHGHSGGDDVLKMIVTVTRAQLRATDSLGRFGGEEFCVIMPETKLENAQAVMERVRVAIEAERVETSTGPVRLTVSIGVAQPRPGESLEQVLERADDAMYRAKAAGRNQVIADKPAT